jgi:ABC-type amino acid transport substrate-binding protein
MANFGKNKIFSGRFIFALLLAVIVAISLDWHGGVKSFGQTQPVATESAGTEKANKSGGALEPLKAKIACSANGKPFQWKDEKGKLTGYDIDVANEIARRANVKLTWETTEWQALFLGLDANLYQIIVNNISKTEERAAKYLYSEDYYLRTPLVIAVRKGVTDIKGPGVDDLAGRKVPIDASGNTLAIFLQKYNEEHPDAQIKLIVSEATPIERLNGVDLGQFDASITSLVILNRFKSETGADLDAVELSREVQDQIRSTESYFLFSHGHDELKARWDVALRSMIDDGTLKEISNRYLDGDYSR